MTSVLDIREENCGNHVRIAVSGEVDIYTSQKLKDKLYACVDEHKKDLKIDCSKLNYIDSTGLGIFVGALKKAKQYEKDVYLTGLKENIKKLFLITGLDKLFIIE